jgi:hypothetical protein
MGFSLYPVLIAPREYSRSLFFSSLFLILLAPRKLLFSSAVLYSVWRHYEPEVFWGMVPTIRCALPVYCDRFLLRNPENDPFGVDLFSEF